MSIMKDELNYTPSITFDNGVEVGFAPINPEVDLSTPQAPTFDETAAANFRQYNLPYRVGKQLFETQYSTVGLIEREEGYNPVTEGMLDGIPREYYRNILSQKTRKDAEIVRANILQELEDYQTAARSGLIANMVSGFGATFLDPTMLVPLGQTVKYLDVTKGFVKNFGKAAVELGAFSAAQNAYLVASKQTQGLSDWVLDTTMDTFFASSIGGALGYYASKNIGKEIKAGQAYFKASNIDADISAKLNAKGEFDGFELDTSKMAGVGAAEVKDIEAMLNSGRVSFRDNKLVKHVFGLGSPIVKGVTSDFEIVQRLTTDLWGTNFRTASGVADAIQDPGAQDWLHHWQGLAAGLLADTRSAYLATIGVSGLAAEERASIGAIAGQYMSELEFNEAVGKAYRRGYSDNPHIDALNKRRKVVFDQMWNEAKKRIPDLQDEEFTNIVNHLIRVYNKDKIAELPDQFFEAQFKYISRVNQKVAAYTQNYENVKTQLQQLKTQYNALLGVKSKDAAAKRKTLKGQISDSRAQLKQLEKQRLDDIRSGVITRDMLESKVKITPEEKRAIDALQKPVKAIEEQLKEAQAITTGQGSLKSLKKLLKENKDIKGLQSSTLSTLTEKIESMGALKARKSLKSFRRSIIEKVSSAKKDAQTLRQKISANLKEVKHAQATKSELKHLIASLEKEKTSAVLNKKETRSIKNKIKKAKEELKALNVAIKDLKLENNTTRESLLDISGTPNDMQIFKEIAKDAQEKLGLDLEVTSLKELDKTIKAIDVAVKKSSGQNYQVAKKEYAQARAKVSELKQKLKSEKAKMYEKAFGDEKNANLLYTDRYGMLRLKNPNKLPELRAVLTPEQLKASALATRDTIEQLNEEQMFGAMFGQVSGNTPASLKGRVNLWNDAEAEPWLINDINVLTDIYLNSMAKYLYGHDVFKKYGMNIEGGRDLITMRLKEQYDLKRNKILENPASPERAKQLRKLDKSLDENIELVSNFQKAYFGSLTDTSSTPYKVSSALRQFTSSVLLTNMPILMLTEFITPTFKHNYKEFVHDGLVGTLSKMKKYNESVRARLGKDADVQLRHYYTDALVGANRLLGQSLEAKMGYAGQTYQKAWYQRFAGVTSKLTDTLSFASKIMDAQEVLEAGRIESKVMRVLEKYHRGEKLLQEEIHFLDEMRIRPKDWAARFVNQFERKVDGRQIGEMSEGGYISNFHEWDDFEASARMRIALNRGVRAVVTKPGPADVPFVFKDPIGSLMFQFLSWPFAATQNFLLPTLTEFDVQKLIGIVNIMAVASIISPLRQLAKGEDVDTSFEALSSSALSNSGIMGWQYDLLTRALAYLDFKLLRPGEEDTPINSALKVLLPERHAGKGLSALIGSPALGTVDMMGSVISSILSGEYNQKDAERTIRILAPYLYTWETQKLFKKALQSTGLPETRREARNE